jgi:hypothetical protein
VARFKDAAEKYGYIVVGSNNSRNGPQPLSEIVRDLSADTHARFSIDDQRIYLAGLPRLPCLIDINLDGVRVPYLIAVLLNRAVRRKMAHAGDIQDRHFGPPLRIGKRLAHLILLIYV